jgi:GNAT superfamily N-acetyltransferase
MIKFQREPGPQIFEELIPLIHLHHKEISHYQDIKLEPDWEQYKRAEEFGVLRAFTARDEQGQLLGYSILFVKTHLHHKSSLQASQDLIFIHPKHRGFGGRFIRWCDEQLKKEGVQAVYHFVNQRHNYGLLLERIGYDLVDLVYTRRIN